MLGPFATVSRFTLSFTRGRYCRHCRTPPAHRCPRRRRRRRRRQRQRQRVTEGTAMAPWNGPNQIHSSYQWTDRPTERQNEHGNRSICTNRPLVLLPLRRGLIISEFTFHMRSLASSAPFHSNARSYYLFVLRRVDFVAVLHIAAVDDEFDHGR